MPSKSSSRPRWNDAPELRFAITEVLRWLRDDETEDGPWYPSVTHIETMVWAARAHYETLLDKDGNELPAEPLPSKPKTGAT